MENWFYMDRKTFINHLHDELGPCLAPVLISCSFDTAISFMIGETSDDILLKIQQIFTQFFCRKRICTENCLLCSITLPNYAKLSWFIQRLLIMRPLSSKTFIKKISSFTTIQQNMKTTNQHYLSLGEISGTIFVITILFLIYTFFCLLMK